MNTETNDIRPATHSVVHYCGPVTALRTGPGYSVLDFIPQGMPVGNGETNNSGEDIIRCRSLYSGVTFLFKKSEIQA